MNDQSNLTADQTCKVCGEAFELHEPRLHYGFAGQDIYEHETHGGCVDALKSKCAALERENAELKRCLFQTQEAAKDLAQRPPSEPLQARVCDDELQIIHEHGQPKGIRDRGGYLFFFPTVQKYSGQEERYREELAERFRLADFLLASLKSTRPLS